MFVKSPSRPKKQILKSKTCPRENERRATGITNQNSNSFIVRHWIVFFVALYLAAGPTYAKTVELVLHPPKLETGKQYCLLAPVDANSNLDADALYEKSAQLLPRNIRRLQISKWLKMPLEQLPKKQVQQLLEKCKPSLELADKASQCSKCHWKVPDKLQPGDSLTKYRSIARILALKVRIHIAQGDIEAAVTTLQAGLSMARHIGKGPTVIQGLVGVAIASSMLEQAEQMISMPDAPSFLHALEKLPKPLVDMKTAMKAESADIKSGEPNKDAMLVKLHQKQLQLHHKRIADSIRKLDRRVAVLICVEILRHYAGSHNGKFPKALTEISKTVIPKDPVTKKPFVYHLEGEKAIIEEPAPKNGKQKEKGRDVMRYELIFEDM